MEGPKRKKRKVSTRKLVKRPKQRGRYKPKSIGKNDADVIDCLFSDDEVKADYVMSNVQGTELEAGDDCDSTSEKSSDAESWLEPDVISPPPKPVPESAGGSRPSSALSSVSDSSFSRPSSSCDVESSTSINLPDDSDSNSSSVVSSKSGVSRPTLNAASDLLMTLGASTPLPRASSSIESFPSPSCDIILAGLEAVKAQLPQAWAVIADNQSFHLLLLSNPPKSVRREVVIFYNGRVSINVHCESIFSDKVLSLNPIPCLTSANEEVLTQLVTNSLKIVKLLMDFDICVGANHEKTRSVWSSIPETYVDLNPYREESYAETCRSVHCQRLVKADGGRVPRCASCAVVMKNLRKRESFLLSDSPHPNTPTMFLTLPQALGKINDLSDSIRQKDKRIDYLEGRVRYLLEKEGVDVDDKVSKDLSDILQGSKLSPIQKTFVEEQLKAAGQKNPRCRRWHPTIIRLALQIKMKSSSAYEALRDSGAIVLPTSRTLYDYTHAIDIQEGVSDGILSMLVKQVEKKKMEYAQYHVLLCDEMYISRNLVHRKKDNSLIGYAKLDEVDREIANLDRYMDQQFSGVQKEAECELARTMLAYMVKGIATDIKYVVAAFPCKSVTADMLYVRTWNVIARLERANVKVLTFVCDGAPTNRTFVGMHVPLTKTGTQGVIFDTLNFCSPEWRPLFFIFDVCHVLKTIRNCFYNSGEEEKKPRCLEINGQQIQWKSIVRLYLTFKNSNFRKSYKLNAQNVFPNAFSCMKVKYAAQVLSDTVANDLEDQNWPDTSERIKFIRYHNKLFDCLNTAYRDQHIRIRNENLKPYTDVNDVRFSWMGVPNEGYETAHGEETPYLQYLFDWRKQVMAKPVAPKKKDKMMLSWQSQQSIETAIRGFAASVRFMLQLEQPPKFILGRAFSQDPLEQHFSHQRAGFGGNRNPNCSQFLGRQVSLAVQRDIGVKTRGNDESASTGMKVTSEPLPKRNRNPKKK